MKARKTIDLEALKELVNGVLSNPLFSQEYKHALCCLMDNMLLQSNAPLEYVYLKWRDGGADAYRAAVDSGLITEYNHTIYEFFLHGGKVYDRVYL